MSRRGSRTSVALLLALTLVLTTPSAFAAPSRDNSNPDFGISRIVRAVKKIVRNLNPATNDTDPGVTWPTPPKP